MPALVFARAGFLLYSNFEIEYNVKLKAQSVKEQFKIQNILNFRLLFFAFRFAFCASLITHS